jgi:hypothetical protein
LQVGDEAKDAALEPALCEGCEEALDGVEPRGRCREDGDGRSPARVLRRLTTSDHGEGGAHSHQI